jgi:hypothetical protein
MWVTWCKNSGEQLGLFVEDFATNGKSPALGNSQVSLPEFFGKGKGKHLSCGGLAFVKIIQSFPTAIHFQFS